MNAHDSTANARNDAPTSHHEAALTMLTPVARTVYRALADACGVFGIAAFAYGPATVVVQETGQRVEEVVEGLRELAASGLIAIEGATTWIVQGLALNPAMSPDDRAHRLAVRGHLLTLPPSSLLQRYRFTNASYFIPRQDDAPPPEAADASDRRPGESSTDFVNRILHRTST